DGRRTRLDFDMPVRTMLSHPGIQTMVVILLIGKDREETWKLLRHDETQYEGSSYPIIETGTGDEDNNQQPQRIDQQMPLATVDFLPPIIPTLGAPHLRGLDRLAIDAHGTGSGLASRCHAGAFSQGLEHLAPRPIITPLGKVVVDGTL